MGLYLSLNGVDFTPTGEQYVYYREAVANVSVTDGAAGGPTEGGTAARVVGTDLSDVRWCR